MNLAKFDNPNGNDIFLLDVEKLLNLELPKECIAGILANMELMRIHARKVEAFDKSEDASEAKKA